MGMLDRYKKRGGFLQLLQLVETALAKKQEQFLGIIEGESKVWADTIREKLITIDRVYSWDSSIHSEIFSRLPTLTLAASLHGMDQETVDALLACLPPISRRKITDTIAELSPSPAEKATCNIKIISEIRSYVSQGVLKLDRIDPSLVIPDNIEEKINTAATAVVMSKVNQTDSPSSVSTSPKPAQQDTGKIKVAEQAKESSNDSNLFTPHDIEILRRKINQLNSELNALKHDNSALRDKLSLIKKMVS
jgi:ribosomal protein S15P/S13E